MANNRGWSPDDDENEGADARKAETDRLNAESNAQQQAASEPSAAAPAGETPAPDSDEPPKT